MTPAVDGNSALFLDIDGTLLDSRWQISEANRAAIAEAARRGIEVALVTGRRYDFALPVAQKIDSPPSESSHPYPQPTRSHSPTPLETAC